MDNAKLEQEIANLTRHIIDISRRLDKLEEGQQSLNECSTDFHERIEGNRHEVRDALEPINTKIDILSRFVNPDHYGRHWHSFGNLKHWLDNSIIHDKDGEWPVGYRNDIDDDQAHPETGLNPKEHYEASTLLRNEIRLVRRMAHTLEQHYSLPSLEQTLTEDDEVDMEEGGEDNGTKEMNPVEEESQSSRSSGQSAGALYAKIRLDEVKDW